MPRINEQTVRNSGVILRNFSTIWLTEHALDLYKKRKFQIVMIVAFDKITVSHHGGMCPSMSEDSSWEPTDKIFINVPGKNWKDLENYAIWIECDHLRVQCPVPKCTRDYPSCFGQARSADRWDRAPACQLRSPPYTWTCFTVHYFFTVDLNHRPMTLHRSFFKQVSRTYFNVTGWNIYIHVL
jgi:hypothetical protein